MSDMGNSGAQPKVRVGTVAAPLAKFAQEKDKRFFPDLSFARDYQSSEDLMPLATYLDTFEQIEKASGDEALLLRAGRDQEISEFGVFGKAMLHGETLWQALETGKVGIEYLVDLVQINIRLKFGRCRIEYTHTFPESLGADLDTQYSVAALYNLIQQAVWAQDPNMVVGFPGATETHRSLFPLAQLVFEARFGVIEFDDKLLKSPMKLSSPNISAIAYKAMEMSDMTSQEDLDITSQVKNLLLASLETTQTAINLRNVSYFLGLPERTLQDRLRREGTSFASLRAESRHEIAREALKSGRTIAETAILAGYSQRQTFSEAFTEWEGTPPSVYASTCRSA